jgi:hypothetical protein
MVPFYSLSLALMLLCPYPSQNEPINTVESRHPFHHQARMGRFLHSILPLRGGFRDMQMDEDEELAESMNIPWDVKPPPTSTRLGPLQMTWGMGTEENWMLRDEIREEIREIAEEPVFLMGTFMSLQHLDLY